MRNLHLLKLVDPKTGPTPTRLTSFFKDWLGYLGGQRLKTCPGHAAFSNVSLRSTPGNAHALVEIALVDFLAATFVFPDDRIERLAKGGRGRFDQGAFIGS